jgi:hypothetical protein
VRGASAFRSTAVAARISRPDQVLLILAVFACGAVAGTELGPGGGHAHTTELVAVGVVVALVAVSVHAVNEFADVETDARTVRTRFSGGSGALEEHGLGASFARRLAVAAGLLAVAGALAGPATGLWSVTVTVLLLVGLVGGWQYSVPPLALSRRGGGEVTNALLGALLLPVAGAAVVGAAVPTAAVQFLPFRPAGCSRPSRWGPASTSTTWLPRRAKPWPSSHPTGPPPRTSSRVGSSSRSHTDSEVRGPAALRPATSGTSGAEPVATRAWVKATGRPSTSALRVPVKLSVPCATATPDSRNAAGESIGSIAAIASRTCRITAGKSTCTSTTDTPSRLASRAADAAWADASRDLLGTHPVHRQSPPVRSRSTSSAVAPSSAAVCAATRPAVPPPTTRRSHGRP